MTSDFTQFILDQLTGLGSVRARRMFGGAGIYCDDVFFAIVHQDSLYFKVDDTNRAAFLKTGAVAFQPYVHRPTTFQYYAVPAEVLEDTRALRDWARSALAVARHQANKKPLRRMARLLL